MSYHGFQADTGRGELLGSPEVLLWPFCIHRKAQHAAYDPRLTTNTYTDETLLPIASEVASAPAILDIDDPQTDTITLLATGTDQAGAQRTAQQKVAPTRHSGSSSVTHEHSEGARGDVQSKRLSQPQVERVSRHAIKKHGSSSGDNEPLKKRVMGFEPTTFTLAT